MSLSAWLIRTPESRSVTANIREHSRWQTCPLPFVRSPSRNKLGEDIGGHGHPPRSPFNPNGDALDDLSLPGWLYYEPEFLEAEKKAFLRAAPQAVCHESEISKPGEWRSLEYLGESLFVIRGDDREVRAFSNVCRHRGSRLVDGTGGCAKVLTCPYHAWSYARDGRLVGVPHRQRISRVADRESSACSRSRWRNGAASCS